MALEFSVSADGNAAPGRGGHGRRLRSLPVRAIRRFTVRTALPEPLTPLRELMLNLRWSWHAETRELFAAIDPAGWEASGHDPVALLGEVPADQLAALAGDQAFLRGSARPPTNCASTCPGRAGTSAAAAGPRRAAPAAVAYFSPEYGITEALPQYSGGLGILAGDHLKAGQRPRRAADRRGPAVPARLLHPVAVPRGLADGALPGRATRTGCRLPCCATPAGRRPG